MPDFFQPIETIPAACPGMTWGPAESFGRDAYICSVAMRAGVFVSNTGTANEKTAKLMAAVGDNIIGVPELLTALRSPTGDGINEYGALDVASILRRGMIYVLTDAAQTIAQGAGVFVRYAAGAGGSILGTVRTDVDTASAVSLPNVKAYKATEVLNGVRVTLLQLNLP